ncbi:uncharacterized protein LOC141627911 [Silene latifolia]|uniref:uncharacterized protein LOC141627911 n=1 Tax=Silene latifolia TaxID=37657 RepID=UPI003D77B8BF
MFQVVKKLKALKPVLKNINKECFSDIEYSTSIVSVLLDRIQKNLIDNPGHIELMQQEYDTTDELRELIAARDSFLMQKAKVQWSLEGDLNTTYFHHIIKKRVMLNKILEIEDKEGVLCSEGETIQNAFLTYYQELLGEKHATDDVNLTVVRRGKCCTNAHALILNMPVTKEEIKTCLFSLPKDKSPGPDGYTSQFFRDAWDIVGEEISGAILNFFKTGKLLAQINSTIITLMPKVDRPSSVKHFRPIACCNVIYKTIYKLICNRLALVLPDIVSRNQGAFVKGSILKNILFCQDLVRLCHRGHVSPRCMFKLDLQKAYDTIEWQFLEQMLAALQFPESFIQMVMCCVTSTTFTLNLNGIQFGYFNGRRDDLLMFCKGDVGSIMLMLRAMATFSAASGLKINASKSDVVFNGVADDVKTDIIQVSAFKEGCLPFTYLGVPIQPTRLTRLDCSILIDKITARVRSIEAICRTFFWEGGVEYQRAPLVAWDNVCCSKKEGGLRIKQAGVWNIATVGKLINWIYTKADRLWVLWIDHVYLKGRDWNSYQPPADSNWNWRNIYKVRDCMAAGYLNNVWLQDPKGYSVASGYHWLHGKHPHVPWMKMQQFGICSADQCVLCENGQETHEHLFDQCAYSRRVLQYVSHWLQGTGTQRSSTVQTRIRRAAKLACWYLIWLERNRCRHELMLARPEKI